MTGENTRSDSKERNRLALGWALTNYDESVDTISDQGRRVDQARYLKDGCVPVIDQGEAFIGGYTDDESKRYDGPLPIIVFGDHTRRVKYVDFPFVVGAQGVKLLMPRECWFPKFFSYLLPSLDIRDRGYSRHFQFIRKLEFPLPPLAEQRRIVAEIEKQCTRLDAAVEALKRVRANLKRYRASVLKAACEGRIVPTEDELARAEGRNYEPANSLLQRILKERRAKWEAEELVKWKASGKTPKEDSWRLRYKEPSSPSVNYRPPLAKGWAWAGLDELLVSLRNGIATKPEASDGIPILRISAVRPLSVNCEDVRFLAGRFERYVEYELRSGDLLFTRYNGNPALVGVCGVVRTLSKRTVYPDKVIRVRVVSDLCLPEVLQIVLNVGISREYLARRVRTTAGQSGVSGGDLRGIPVPLPPLAEQHRIVAEVDRRLSVIDELEALVAANLKRAQRLRQSILKRAFEGKLVPQDPNDEPAAILLERIRAERIANGANAISRQGGDKVKRKQSQRHVSNMRR